MRIQWLGTVLVLALAGHAGLRLVVASRSSAHTHRASDATQVLTRWSRMSTAPVKEAAALQRRTVLGQPDSYSPPPVDCERAPRSRITPSAENHDAIGMACRTGRLLQPK